MTDKIIRGTVAAIIALLYLANIITGTTALILGSIALILFITSVISFCPMYALLLAIVAVATNKSKRNFNL
jgi:O-antigen ligase